MLSERLKKKELFHDGRFDSKCTHAAKDMLNDVIENLVIGMRVAEKYSTMSQEDVEKYVVERLEEIELRYYSDSDEDFDYFVRMFIGG